VLSGQGSSEAAAATPPSAPAPAAGSSRSAQPPTQPAPRSVSPDADNGSLDPPPALPAVTTGPRRADVAAEGARSLAASTVGACVVTATVDADSSWAEVAAALGDPGPPLLLGAATDAAAATSGRGVPTHRMLYAYPGLLFEVMPGEASVTGPSGRGGRPAGGPVAEDGRGQEASAASGVAGSAAAGLVPVAGGSRVVTPPGGRAVATVAGTVLSCACVQMDEWA
jgi:hypothetical protein